MKLNIGVIKGDGIGPEIVTEAMKVLDRIAEVMDMNVCYTTALMVEQSIDVHGVPLTDETISKAKLCDAVLMGSIGGDTRTSPWYQLEPSTSRSRTVKNQKRTEFICKFKTGSIV